MSGSHEGVGGEVRRAGSGEEEVVPRTFSVCVCMSSSHGHSISPTGTGYKAA